MFFFVLQVAASALESSLLKYSAKDYFFSASLCHMCVDALNAQVTKLNFVAPKSSFSLFN
jgi:alpha-soluble NSF attachment protein